MRGRPASGITPMLGFRGTAALRTSILRWASKEPGEPKLSEAIRRLVEIGLAGGRPARHEQSSSTRARAAELAGAEIDRQGDKSASVGEQSERKRKILKGPIAFEDVRIDRNARKTKPS